MKNLTPIGLAILFLSCEVEKPSVTMEKRTLSEEQKSFWYAGDAEVSSFRLSQSRYGETREGTASVIFVTEPFSTSSWTKADRPGSEDVSVLKMNFTKKFVTGIYPYSMMTSTFLPFDRLGNSLKITSSSQEWCGQTFMEMRSKQELEIDISSYFEGENANLILPKNLIEDDIWSMIRLGPEQLQQGTVQLIPSFFFLRMNHIETKAYEADLSVNNLNDSLSQVTLEYSDIDRSLSIQFENQFPHRIVGWEETYMDGFGPNRKEMTSSGELLQTIKVDYWTKNRVRDSTFRQQLMLN